MSVFKAREFWDAPVAQKENELRPVLSGVEDTDLGLNCSRGSMCLVRLPDKPGADVIIVGTWSGVIRGYSPDQASYTTDHLLFEKELDDPILQILCGNFVLGSSGAAFQLAVLQPEKITICYYSVSKTSEDAAGLNILRVYKLKASAYIMVSGSFGGVKGREMLCVATLDGRFTLIDQETVIQTPVLEDFLFPGPMCYLTARDSCVVASSSWTADCYSYSEMASKAGLIASKPDAQIHMRKSWTYNCGESLVDIQSSPEADKNFLLLLGERHLFWLDSNGSMTAIRKLDCSPSFISLYSSGKEGAISMIMGTTTKTLFVYENMIPKWTSQLPYPVLDVQAARVASTDGILVALAETGGVSAYYLGTDPEVYEIKAAAVTRKFNEDEIKLETQRLAEMIKQQESGAKDQISTVQEEPSPLTITVGAFGDITTVFDPRSATNQRVPVSKTQIVLAPRSSPLMDAQIDVQVTEPIVATLSHSDIESIDRPMTVGLTVQNTLQTVPQALTGTVVVRFTQAGIPKVQKVLFGLPISLIAQSAALTKKAALKFDFDISPHPVRLVDIFPDFASHEENLGLTMDFYGSGVATILISKKQEAKIRIQSDHPCLVNIVCREFQRRMTFLAPECSITCASNFPSSDFESLINEKTVLRKTYAKLTEDVGLWTSQLFVVEKRFLARLKDRDLGIVNKLEELLEDTQEKIIEAVDQCEATQRSLEDIRMRMSSMINFMHWLVTVNNKQLTNDDAKMLQQIVDGALEETSDETWEKRCSQSAKYYVYQKLSQGNIGSSVAYQADFSDPVNLLKRAYLNQLDIGIAKKREVAVAAT